MTSPSYGCLSLRYFSKWETLMTSCICQVLGSFRRYACFPQGSSISNGPTYLGYRLLLDLLILRFLVDSNTKSLVPNSIGSCWASQHFFCTAIVFLRYLLTESRALWNRSRCSCSPLIFCPLLAVIALSKPGCLLGGRLVRSGVIYWSQCVEGSVVVYIVYIGC